MLDAKVDSRESTDVQALYEAEVEKGLHAPVTLMTAAQIIQFLDLKPHPEGGHCRETFRDATGIGGRPRPQRSISYWPAANARIGIGSMQRKSGTTTLVRH